VSGPNLGCNVGVDVFYSGTVAAALEGGFCGVTSVAVSTSRENEGCMDAVAEQAMRVLRPLLDAGMPAGTVLNVNIPALCETYPEVRVTRQSTQFPPGLLRRAEGPRGRVHYYLDSADETAPAAPDSDVAALEAGAISVTPLRRDLTDEAAVRPLKDMLRVVAAKSYD